VLLSEGSVNFEVTGGLKIRIVFVHVDYVRYCAKKKTKTAEPINVKRDYMEEGVVLFCRAEKIDEDSLSHAVAVSIVTEI